MKIGIDIDDTLTNTREAQVEFWKEYVLENPSNIYTTKIPENINRFGDSYIDTFWDMYRERLFSPKFKENASETIARLRKDGHKIYIITSRPQSKYSNLIEKLEYIFTMNNIEYDYIVTDIKEKGKYMYDYDIDVLIDDDILHCKDAFNYGKKSILFNNYDDYKGLMTNNWEKIYDIISNLKD